MKKVRVYYAGIPPRNKNQEKVKVLDNFHEGVPKPWSEQIHTKHWQPSDLAVIQGWVHPGSQRSPHLQFRRLIIDNQKAIGKHTLAIDSNLFLYRDPGNTKSYLRFSLNDVFPNTGQYFTDNPDPERWQQIQRDLNIGLKPWRKTGKHILICMQRNGGWSMGGQDANKWLMATIHQLRQHTDRQIIVRGHPGDKKNTRWQKINIPGVKISKQASILADFHKCWAVVTYNSSPGVAAAIDGIPVFVTDPSPNKSQAYKVANFDLSKIEYPLMPVREQWIEKIAMSHYNFDDLQSGKAWSVMKDYLK